MDSYIEGLYTECVGDLMEESLWNELNGCAGLDNTCVAVVTEDEPQRVHVAIQGGVVPSPANERSNDVLAGCDVRKKQVYSKQAQAPSIRNRCMRAACEASFNVNQYPCRDTIQKLAESDNMTPVQVSHWFINKRRRMGSSLVKKPFYNIKDYNMIVDWLIEHPHQIPSRELKLQWGEQLGKTHAQVSQWIINLKKRGRKNTLFTRGEISMTSSGTFYRN